MLLGCVRMRCVKYEWCNNNWANERTGLALVGKTTSASNAHWENTKQKINICNWDF